jgi:hypothetical protein
MRPCGSSLETTSTSGSVAASSLAVASPGLFGFVSQQEAAADQGDAE